MFFFSSQVRSAKVTWDRVEWRQQVIISMTVSISSLDYQVSTKPHFGPHCNPLFYVNVQQNFVLFHDGVRTVDCGNRTTRVNTLWWRNVGRCCVDEQGCHLLRAYSTDGYWTNVNGASVEWYREERPKYSERTLRRPPQNLTRTDLVLNQVFRRDRQSVSCHSCGTDTLQGGT